MCQAVLPDCNIKNFTSDWNNGIHLSALLDYCRYSFDIYIYTNLYLHIISISTIIYRPGLMPNWQRLNPANGPDNVRRAMEIAEREFRIPMVLEPDHFAR